LKFVGVVYPQNQKGVLADIIAVEGNPSEDMRNIRTIKLVIKNGVIYKQ
jgi:imidazolonepropionase-like amidohydrolase